MCYKANNEWMNEYHRGGGRAGGGVGAECGLRQPLRHMQTAVVCVQLGTTE